MSVTPSSASKLPTSDYVVFGGTGDLSFRKIFPAFFWRYLDVQLTDDFWLFATSRRAFNISDFAEALLPFCEDAFAKGYATEECWQAFLNIIQIVIMDVANGNGVGSLVTQIEEKASIDRPAIFYLAIAPSLFAPAVQMLKTAGLASPQARLVVEKPLVNDSASSRAINKKLTAVFNEHQKYQIDHYLGKETLQNLMVLRFANVIFESLWSNQHIDHVQITVAETVGVSKRADYYNRFGATRDMVRNYILQLVCLVAMEPPPYFAADQVRDEKLHIVRALRPLLLDELALGQYAGYREELGEASNTETYVAMKLYIDNWRWAGIPFYIRTGKKLQQQASEIIITFKNLAHEVFAKSGDDKRSDYPNRLVIHLQPSVGLRLHMTSKQPGPGGMRLSPSDLNLSFEETFEERLPDAYERLLMDTALANQTLFMRGDEVMAGRSFIDPILAMSANIVPATYVTGSMGPDDTLLKMDGRQWIDPDQDWR